MSVSDFWTKISKPIAIILLLEELFLGYMVITTCMDARVNTYYMAETPTQYIRGVTLDKDGVHKGGKTYQTADETVYWVLPKEETAYDIKNFCAFAPLEYQTILAWIVGAVTSGIFSLLCSRSKRYRVCVVILTLILLGVLGLLLI